MMSGKIGQRSWHCLSCGLCPRTQQNTKPSVSVVTNSFCRWINKGVFSKDCNHLNVPKPQISSLKFFSTSHTDLPAIAKNILDETRITDVMTDSLNPQDVETLLLVCATDGGGLGALRWGTEDHFGRETFILTGPRLVSSLLSFGFQPLEVESLLTGRVWLMQQSEPLVPLISSLNFYELTPSVLLDLVTLMPYDMQNEAGLAKLAHSIESSVALLMGMGYRGKGLRVITEKCPTIFFIDKGSWEENWMQLQTLFSAQDARIVVSRNVNVLSDPWEKSLEKYDYAHYKMGYDGRQIVDSNVFSHSPRHIQDRHLFLSRAGLFAYVKLKDDARLNPNLRLSDVVERRIEWITSKLNVPYLDHVQYRTFCQMRKIERRTEKKEKREMEGFSDDDDDDNEEEEEEDDTDDDNNSFSGR